MKLESPVMHCSVIIYDCIKNTPVNDDCHRKSWKQLEAYLIATQSLCLYLCFLSAGQDKVPSMARLLVQQSHQLSLFHVCKTIIRIRLVLSMTNDWHCSVWNRQDPFNSSCMLLQHYPHPITCINIAVIYRPKSANIAQPLFTYKTDLELWTYSKKLMRGLSFLLGSQ